MGIQKVEAFRDIHEALDHVDRARHGSYATRGLLASVRGAAFDEGCAADTGTRKIKTWVQLRDAVRDGKLDPAEVERLVNVRPS